MKNTFFSIILLCFVCCNCVKEFERPSWEVDALVPVMHTSMTIQDIVKDSLLTTGEGDSLFIVFSENLIPVEIDTILKLQFKPFIKHIKLDSIRLNDQEITESATLGEVITEAGLSGVLTDGSSTFIPDIPGIGIGPIEVDGSQYFQSINLKDGLLEITVHNGFPVDVTNIQYAIVNQLSGDTVHYGTFPDLPAGATDYDSVSLAGKTIEGLLDIELTADVVGSGFSFVTIDYSDMIETTVRIADMEIYSAHAIFPAQNVINHKEVVPLMDMGDMELTEAWFQSGSLRITITSTIEEESYFTYFIPNATKDGVEFMEEMTGPPAPPGGSQSLEFIYEFEGYEFDLRGLNGDTINAFYNEVIGRIDSTGNLVFLTLEDSVDVRVEVLEMNPSAAFGYMGKNTFSAGPDSIAFDALDEFQFDSLSVAGARLSFRIENYIGMDGEVDLNQVTAINTKTNEVVNMELNNLNLPFRIDRATDGAQITPTRATFNINDNNSNPSEIINIFPDKFLYSVDITTNPDGNDSSFSDFIYADYTINSFLDIEIPLNIKAGGLSLSDTVQLFEEPIEDLDNIKEGTLKFYVTNGFPLAADIYIRFYNSSHILIDQLSQENAVAPGLVDDQNIVYESVMSNIDYFVEEEVMQEILAAKYAVITAVLRTKPDGEYLQIFSNYTLDVNVVGDFVYKISDIHVE